MALWLCIIAPSASSAYCGELQYAEYERAQILERSRRGKRHRAQAGEVSVLGGAPYGYRYIRKTDEALAAYIVEESEARVVQQ